MQIHNIKREHPNQTKKRVARGGRRGKTAGRGHKGQKARAGSKLRPEIRDHIKKIPKLRGYKFNPYKQSPEVVNVSVLSANFETGTCVTPKVLSDAGLVRQQKGRVPAVKVLGNGELSTKLDLARCTVSESAKKKIEEAGGKVV
jgi:large subunit ribosomal protein L15